MFFEKEKGKKKKGNVKVSFNGGKWMRVRVCLCVYFLKSLQGCFTDATFFAFHGRAIDFSPIDQENDAES
jgi:hypothetical protein